MLNVVCAERARVCACDLNKSLRLLKNADTPATPLSLSIYGMFSKCDKDHDPGALERLADSPPVDLLLPKPLGVPGVFGRVGGSL